MPLTVTRHDDIALLTWNDGENRLNYDSLGALNTALDELQETDGPLAVVVTGEGKFFSNGLDLARFGQNMDEMLGTIALLRRTIGRLLLYPAYTVAAINGHCFAGGGLLSTSFDYRVMREDRGFWCMNEAAIGMVLDEYLFGIINHRLPRATAVEAATTARRYSGPEAVTAGIVEAATSEGELLSHAMAQAAAHTWLDRRLLGAQKKIIHGDFAAFLGFSA
jgi:enoyl-CoA hydratase/carnithine racemase